MMTYNPNFNPIPIIEFVISTGYKDVPDFNEDGKPSSRRTTAMHHAARYNYYYDNIVSDLFQIYDRFDVNYTDERGLTHFHIACEYGLDDVVKKFLELGQDPNIIERKRGDTPLHLALSQDEIEVAKLLLESGANPNLANIDLLTPLHVLCKDCYDDYEMVELFFEINDEVNQLVQVDALDTFGRTPLQWAVARIAPNTVDVLLDRGADMSSFVFPNQSYFGEEIEPHLAEVSLNFKLRLASGALAVAESLEKRGYELVRSDALKIMTLFSKYGWFEKSADYDEYWYDDEEFVSEAKKIMMNPSLCLYDLIRLRPKEATKLLTYKDCSGFRHSDKLSKLPEKHKEACATHLLEKLPRRFFQRWALDPFLELTRYELPILCCEIIIEQLKNEDLWHICLTTAGKI
ncbi:unnamed protein product [Trichogramma brassicae]|uniref:Uncharacterized protein n=1 Tax=Trichogramma brassicae TaxID=86971 RepID=A0A6H5HZU9_9HYME|nr:unnamed protein product [Trichogramma brassicae]